MSRRADLHALIDDLPESALDRARRSLESVLSPMEQALAKAPVDDEPETEEESEAVRQARESGARGELGVSLADLRRELGV